MKSAIKSRLDELERQLADRTSDPTMIVIDVVNASAEGPQEIVPAGYTCNIKGKRQFFPGSSDEAVAAVRELIDLEPRVRGVARPVPVLMACLEAPTDEPMISASCAEEVMG